MPATLDEVKNLISGEFVDADVTEITEVGSRIIGTIRSPEFEHMTSTQRNQEVTKRVRDKLGLRGLNVGILFPRAPGKAV